MSNGIHKALIAIMGEVEAIGKDQKNQQQGFMFRGIDQIYGALHDLLAKHKVITIPIAVASHTEERTNTKGTVLRHTTSTVTYRFLHEDGSYVDGQVLGEGMDSGDKAASKSLAIAHKYFLLQTFLIPTEEQKDPDYEAHQVQPKKQDPPKSEEPQFNGPNHQQLYEELTGKFISPDDFMGALKNLKQIPESAKSFFAMTDKTASKYTGKIEEIDDIVTEYKALAKP